MSINIRDFDVMVNDTLQRIVDAGVGITNINVGSVIRTIVESIIAEIDINYYQINQIYNALNIDNAVGADLDSLVSILGVVRKPATKCHGIVTFNITQPSSYDINIPFAQIISTRQDRNGNMVEFIVTDDDKYILAGELSVDVNVESINAGSLYIPTNALNIMNTPIIGIESVHNGDEIVGGTDAESDELLRSRAKQALSNLGKGTNIALESALLNIPDVLDAMVIDMSRGVGTADIVVVTASIPPSTELNNEILSTVDSTKSAGIDVEVVYPTIVSVDVEITVTDGDIDVIGNAIISYFSTLKISQSFIINQMERFVLNACNIDDMDMSTITPSNNVDISGTEIIRSGIITINGDVWNG